jgi:hypothetical protein
MLDGGLAAIFAQAFGEIYLDGALYRPATYSDDGAGGGSDGAFGDPEDVKVQPEATTQAMRDSPGYVDTDKRYLVLASGHSQPNTDCELSAEGTRWSVVNWSRDPASAYYDLHCRFLRNA